MTSGVANIIIGPLPGPTSAHVLYFFSFPLQISNRSRRLDSGRTTRNLSNPVAGCAVPPAKVWFFLPPEGMGAQQRKDEEAGGVVKSGKVADITMDLDILDCPICYHPLRPPVFQCTVGHTICSSCHDKLPDKCHFCSLPTVYSRCHMVEHIIESIKVSCSNANHGCTARITYYQKEEHENGCPHAPCFCPETGCSFSTGSTMMLLGHLSRKHDWHSGTAIYNMALRISFSVGSTVLLGEDGHLFLVNMTLDLLCGVITFCSVQPHNTGSKFKCRLMSSLADGTNSQTTFVVRSTNLHDGLPKDCLRFHVPKVLLRSDGASTTAAVSLMLMPQ